MLVGTSFILSLSLFAEDEVYAEYPELTAPKKNNEAQVQRGAYLTKAGDCIACHTQVGGAAFAGGLALVTPFGTFYTPNITPDKQNGIGSWTDAQFLKAMRHGIRPDGLPYYPAFPYVYYNKASDEDILAIKAYLERVPISKQENKEHEIFFPFNIRSLQYLWQWFFFYLDSGALQEDATQPELWNRGRYLVEGLAHCGMCHTPMNFAGVAKKRLAYTGNYVDGWYAPNITGTSLSNVSEQQLLQVFTQNKKPGGKGEIQGPMRQVNHDSLMHLDHEDLMAISTYIKSTTQVIATQPAVPILSNDASALGMHIYQGYCAQCHDVGSAGAPKIGDHISWQARMANGVTGLYNSAIAGVGVMAAKGLCPDDETCPDDAVRAAVDYILSRSLNSVADTPIQPDARRAVKPKRYTMEDGRELFVAHCASCHVHGEFDAPRIAYPQDWVERKQLSLDVLIEAVISGKQQSDDLRGCLLPMGGCEDCDDAQIIAIVKYMLQSVADPGKNYSKW